MRRTPVSSDKRFTANKNSANGGTQERWQHSGRVLELTEQAGVVAVRATEEHVLDILLLRHWVTATHRTAGLRFKHDFHAAGLEAHVTGSYNPARTSFSPFGSGGERNEGQEAAYQRWRHAVRALGSNYSDMVITISCHDCMPNIRHLPKLREGLELLVKWYRLPDER